MPFNKIVKTIPTIIIKAISGIPHTMLSIFFIISSIDIAKFIIYAPIYHLINSDGPIIYGPFLSTPALIIPPSTKIFISLSTMMLFSFNTK